MERNGLTMTMIFLAESANYGESIGNISSLKKLSRGDYAQYSYITRQAIRYNIVQQAGWNNTPVDNSSKTVQYSPSATIEDYPEIDLFGYMKTIAKDDKQKGGATTRSAVARLSNAIALEPFQGDLDFLTNMGLAARGGYENGIAQSEMHRSYYTYTISIDLDRVGIDGDLTVDSKEKTERVNTCLSTIQYLYRDIKGRRENLSPLFIIGGRYSRKNPFFENRVQMKGHSIQADTLKEILENDEIRKYTYTGVLTGIFQNESEIKEKLSASSIENVFEQLKKEVEQYYAESN